MGKGGGGGPTQTTAYQTNLPEYAQPFVTSMLEATQQQLFTGNRDAEGNYNITGFKPYQAYSSDPTAYFAGPTTAQTEAYNQALNMRAPGQYGEASNLASAAAERALGTQFTPGQFSNQFYSPAPYTAGQFGTNYRSQSYTPGQFGMMNVSAPRLQQYQMGPAERVGAEGVGTGAFTDQGNVSNYMSPYQQAVTDVAKAGAVREAQIAQKQADLSAARQGTYGGSRQLIAKLERERNLLTNLAGIQAKGGQDAYNAAMQAYQSDAARQLQAQQANQQAGLQAALANQQAGLSVGGQNLQALLGVQQLGAGQSLQAQLANQQALQNMQAQQEASRQFGATFGESSAARLAQLQQAAEQSREASRQFAANQGMTAAQLQAQYGLSAQQAAEASRQFATNAGLQAAAQANQAASTLGQIGGAQQQADLARVQLMNQLGQQQQLYQQGIINQQIQDYATAQQYPMMQLGFMSNMLRGLPMQATTTQSYQAQPNLATQAISGLGAAAGAYRAFGMKAGGKVPSYAGPEGSEVEMGMKAKLEALASTDAGLAQVAKIAETSPSVEMRKLANQVLIEKQMERQAAAKAEQSIAQDQSKGLAAAPAPAMDTLGAASGGIVAFANEGQVEEDEDKYGQYVRDVQRARLAAGVEGSPIDPKLKAMYEERLAGLGARRESDVGLNMIDFFSRMNKPGSTLSAGIAAAGEALPGIAARRKELAADELAITKGMADLTAAERAEKLGISKEALAAYEKEMDREKSLDVARIGAAQRPTDLDRTTTAFFDELIAGGAPNNAATKAQARKLAIQETGLLGRKVELQEDAAVTNRVKTDPTIKALKIELYSADDKDKPAIQEKIAAREAEIKGEIKKPGTPAAPDTSSGRFPKPDIAKVPNVPPGSSIGAQTSMGWEVKDKNGKVIGHIQK